MKKITVLLIVGLGVFFNHCVFASDLEVVEQDQAVLNQAIAIEQQALPASEPVQPQEAVKAETPKVSHEAVLPSEVKTEPIIVRDTAETMRPSTAKTRPMPPAVVSKGVDEPTRYTLGPDDVIEITVRRHQEFSGSYPINAEGKIQYKFVGDIEIKGLTKTEVKDRIAQILGKFIINPDVEVTILEYRSKVIYVIGEVGAPGKYYMKADKISVREAVVQAGLPTLSASMRKTQLIRPDKSGKPQEKRMDLYALLYEGKLNLDLDMYSGDVLVVPATIFAKIMRIVQPVAAPVASSDTIRRVGTGGF